MGPTRRLVSAPISSIPAAIALTVCATLPALAYASPPDPVWIQGIYDDADYDDVVGLVTAGSGDLGPAAPTDLQSTLPLAGNLQQRDDKATLARSTTVFRPRAPPAS